MGSDPLSPASAVLLETKPYGLVGWLGGWVGWWRDQDQRRCIGLTSSGGMLNRSAGVMGTSK
jgi:hypothetical protein